MASNKIPESAGLKISLGTSMYAGLSALGTTLGITQITAAAFKATLDAFVSAEQTFNARRGVKRTASGTSKSSAEELYDWELVVRTVLAGELGARWSASWTEAGFVNATTAIPRKKEQRLSLALCLENFFTAHPAYEVESMSVTATQATTLRDAALASQEALTQAEMSLSTGKTARDAAVKALVTKMRALIKILGATLAEDDVRWEAFGLNMPAADTTPGQPQNVSAVLDETGAIVLGCDAVPYGARYRWRMQLVGAESGYVLVKSSTGTSAVVKKVLPGQTAQFIVQAASADGSQGVASAPVTITVPELAVAMAKGAGFTNLSTEKKAAVPGEKSNGHSNGNGHARPARAS